MRKPFAANRDTFGSELTSWKTTHELPISPLQRMWSSLTLGTTPLNDKTFRRCASV